MKSYIPQAFVFLSSCVLSLMAVCDVCQVNKVACINSTSFYLCFGGSTPNRNTIYHCNEGFDCTDLNAICVQSISSRPPSCGDTSLCGQCRAHQNHLFACLSRNTFQMCYGAQRPSGQIGYCPTNYICDASNDNICIHTTQQHAVTCDVNQNEMGQTTISPLTPYEVCAQMIVVGLFSPIPNDPLCKRYIYCNYNNNAFKGVEFVCSAGTYFAIEMKQCSHIKPLYCI